MSGSAIDVLMRIQGRGGAFPGEASTRFEVSETVDKLRKDFKEGFFCELQEFSFSAGAESALKSADDLERERRDKLKKADKRRQEEEALRGAARPSSGPPSPENRIKAIEKAAQRRLDRRGAGEFVDMRPVEFTRLFDSSSTQLFTALTSSETLPVVTVVKRKASGVAASGLCYLRLDFEDVLMTELTWKDATHVVIETGTFIYKKLKISYAPQSAGGSLLPAVTADWAMKAAR